MIRLPTLKKVALDKLTFHYENFNSNRHNSLVHVCIWTAWVLCFYKKAQDLTNSKEIDDESYHRLDEDCLLLRDLDASFWEDPPKYNWWYVWMGICLGHTRETTHYRAEQRWVDAIERCEKRIPRFWRLWFKRTLKKQFEKMFDIKVFYELNSVILNEPPEGYFQKFIWNVKKSSIKKQLKRHKPSHPML